MRIEEAGHKIGAIARNGAGKDLRAIRQRDPTASAQLKFRVPESLRARIEDAAKAHGLTLNAEITMRLEQSFELDQQRRDLGSTHDSLRRELEEARAREAEAHRRVNKLVDHLLQAKE